jgi:hypothetical protein
MAKRYRLALTSGTSQRVEEIARRFYDKRMTILAYCSHSTNSAVISILHSILSVIGYIGKRKADKARHNSRSISTGKTSIKHLIKEAYFDN